VRLISVTPIMEARRQAEAAAGARFLVRVISITLIREALRLKDAAAASDPESS
jgi:hypothetical protein